MQHKDEVEERRKGREKRENEGVSRKFLIITTTTSERDERGESETEEGEREGERKKGESETEAGEREGERKLIMRKQTPLRIVVHAGKMRQHTQRDRCSSY